MHPDILVLYAKFIFMDHNVKYQEVEIMGRKALMAVNREEGTAYTIFAYGNKAYHCTTNSDGRLMFDQKRDEFTILELIRLERTLSQQSFMRHDISVDTTYSKLSDVTASYITYIIGYILRWIMMYMMALTTANIILGLIQ